MDIKFIALVILLLFAIAILLIILFKNLNKKSFISEDGSVFDNESDLNSYEIIYGKTKSFFSIEDQKRSNNPILGFEISFLTKLSKEGFSDLKTLFKYRKQIKSLSDLINT